MSDIKPPCKEGAKSLGFYGFLYAEAGTYAFTVNKECEKLNISEKSFLVFVAPINSGSYDQGRQCNTDEIFNSFQFFGLALLQFLGGLLLKMSRNLNVSPAEAINNGQIKLIDSIFSLACACGTFH
ncbi:hypothetical protein LOK82_13140 [Xylella fastidiosa subsp. multiplex]|uniref:Uncharacterized protein n=1 Tax=Xylella fastidiosa subsp. multiplex TaxID=644357 RepID=A0AAW6I0P5_XYLFS|nr:hypothetical protein [Xylella fastidiosa subsp. multiplex]